MSDELPDCEGVIQSPLYGGQYDWEQMVSKIEAIIRSNGRFRTSAEQILELFRANPPRHSWMNLDDAESLYWGDGVYGLKLTGQENLEPGRSHGREFVIFLGQGEEARAARDEVRLALEHGLHLQNLKEQL